jgi:predicted PurR-regulated permease PerM
VYGFFLGVFGMVTAWRMTKTGRARKSLSTLAVLLVLGTMFSLSAFIFVFVVTYQTTGQHIREPIALNSVGINYSHERWTPETWFQAILDLPLADGAQHAQIKSRVRGMVTWRWILLPLFLVYMVALYFTAVAWLRQRRLVTERTSSAHTVEKTGSR